MYGAAPFNNVITIIGITGFDFRAETAFIPAGEA